MPAGGGRRQASRVKRQVLDCVVELARQIVAGARTRRVSVKLRTLVKYGYTAYAYDTLDLGKARGLSSRVSVPRYLANPSYYRSVEEELARNFEVEFEKRRDIKYVVFRARLAAPLPQNLQPGVADGEAR